VIRATFLGTAASRPTVGRNVAGLLVQREGELLLFDCGEGTQRQMMRYSTGFSVNDIFITHMHADHFLGIIGLLRTLGLQAREEVMKLYAPAGTRSILNEAVHLGVERVTFPIEIIELECGDRITRQDYDIVAYATQHGTRAVGFALVEHERLGRFNIAKARAMGVPEGPLFGKLHRGETVTVDGRDITAAEVVGPPRSGRKLVYTGDTRPCRETIDIARGADLLIHDATFGEEESERARQTGHSTAREAADVARRAEVDKLLLTHISARYADDPRVLEREAREIFARTAVAHDGMVVEIPYREDEQA
jgi:ribonuclease Z